MNERLQAKLATLPMSSGCYLMKDKNGTIIYVGKAKKLKNRVNQYFRGAHDYKTTKLVSNIVDFDYVVTSSEKEALLLEINLIKKYRPEIVLMDINMPEKDGLTAIAEIEKLDLGVRTIALTGYDDPDLIFRAMKIGAKGYILKTMASAQLIYAIDEVAAGKIYLPATLSSRFFY